MRNLRNHERYMESVTAKAQEQSREMEQIRHKLMATEPETEDGGVRKRPHPFPQGDKKNDGKQNKKTTGTWEPEVRTASQKPRRQNSDSEEDPDDNRTEYASTRKKKITRGVKQMPLSQHMTLIVPGVRMNCRDRKNT